LKIFTYSNDPASSKKQYNKRWKKDGISKNGENDRQSPSFDESVQKLDQHQEIKSMEEGIDDQQEETGSDVFMSETEDTVKDKDKIEANDLQQEETDKEVQSIMTESEDDDEDDDGETLKGFLNRECEAIKKKEKLCFKKTKNKAFMWCPHCNHKSRGNLKKHLLQHKAFYKNHRNSEGIDKKLYDKYFNIYKKQFYKNEQIINERVFTQFVGPLQSPENQTGNFKIKIHRIIKYKL
jgi:hypothetical protein